MTMTHKISSPGIWYTEFDGNGNCTKAVYEASYRRLLGFESEEEYADARKNRTDSIHPEDAERLSAHMAECTARHPEGMDFDIEYRMMTRRGYRWFHDYGRCVRNEAGDLLRCDGVIFDIQNSVDQETLHEELSENNLRVLALEENFVSLYDVDLETGHYEIYVREHILNEDHINHMVNNNDFFEDTVKNASLVIHPDDRAELIRVLRRDFILETLAKDKHFDFFYRLVNNGETVWARLRFAYKNSEKRHIIVGAFNAEAEMAQKKYEEERRQNTETQLKHERLRAEILNYMVDHDDDPIELLKSFAERIRVLINCDQVIYRDLEETRIMVNSPAIEESWSVPIEYCMQCQHFDAHHPMYAGGYTEMDNCQEGWQGIPVYQNCPIKSSLTRIVYCDGEIAGYLAIHYVQNYHHFTDTERSTLEEFTRILSISLSRYAARQENKELKRIQEIQQQLERSLSEAEEANAKLAEQSAFTRFFLEPYQSAYYVGLNDRSCQIYKRMDRPGELQPDLRDYERSMSSYIGRNVHPEDRAEFRSLIRPEIMKEKLAGHPEFSYSFRGYGADADRRFRFQVIRGADEDHAAFGFRDITEEWKKEQEQYALSDGLSREYHTVWLMEGTGDHNMHLYRSTGVKTVKSAVRQGLDKPSYDTGILKYIREHVHEEDQDRVIEETKFETVARETPETGTYVVTYRRYNEDRTDFDYHQMCYARALAADGTVNFIFAYRDADRMMRDQIAQQEKLAQRTVLSDYFLRSYASAYYVDLKKRTLLVLHTSRSKAVFVSGRILPMDKTVAAYSRNAHPEDRERFIENLDADFIREQLKMTEEINFIYRDISSFAPGTYRVTIIPGADADHAAVGFQNITEDLRQQEERQKQLQEALSMAQSANRAKTTFLNNMSHDIRTPMNAIIGYTGLAASHIDNREQVRDYLSKIRQSSDHLLSLINDVLDMSRIESGKMNLEEKEENLSDIIHTLRDIVQADINSKQLDFFVDAVDVNDEDIVCDKLRLNQVLLNVLSNSIKYTAAGGSVSVRVRETDVKSNGYASYEFRIRDNGMGMSREFLATIFDPFTRVRSSTVSGIQGTGLGMAITKNIVDMMGGKIGVESELGKGTEVTLNFDFRLQSSPKLPEELPEFKNVRVLVADDDANTCLSICNMVRDIGMRYEWCTSGKEAVIRAEAAFNGADPFGVYLTDWVMPDLNGIETCRRIRRAVGDEAPIIALTAYDWSDIEEEARAAGITAFVSKPMFPSDLRRVLSRCLGKEAIAESGQMQSYDFAGRRVLLVEDNEMNREIATEILEENGFEVDSAEDGDIAVEKMKTAGDGTYDLILMDVQMPRMDGYEATRQIRALGTEASKLPILAMTANAFEEDRRAALEAGMNEHIAKPFNIDKLKEMLARFL